MSKLNIPVLLLKLPLTNPELANEFLKEEGTFDGYCRHVGIRIQENKKHDDILNGSYHSPCPYFFLRDTLVKVAHELPLRNQPKDFGVDWTKTRGDILNSETRQAVDPILAKYTSTPLSLKIDMMVDGERFKLKDGFERATTIVVPFSSEDALKSIADYFQYFFSVAREVKGGFFNAMRPIIESTLFDIFTGTPIDLTKAGSFVKQTLSFSLQNTFYDESTVSQFVFEIGDYDKYGIAFMVQVLNMEAYVDICRHLSYALHGDFDYEPSNTNTEHQITDAPSPKTLGEGNDNDGNYRLH